MSVTFSGNRCPKEVRTKSCSGRPLTLQMRLISLCLALVSATFLAGCQTAEPPYVEKSVGELYNNAMDYLAAKDYSKASENFDEVERQHPYSPWAAKSLLMSAYANFMGLDYDKALMSLQTFIQLHPGHADIPYAYYLRALCYYDRIGPVANEQTNTAKAVESLQDVVRRFPRTPYARDARFKIALARSRLAGHDLSVALFYQKKNAFVAALGRLQNILDHYQETSFVPEALYRMTEIYLSLGLKDQARAAASVLGENFPVSSWYRDAYELLQPA